MKASDAIKLTEKARIVDMKAIYDRINTAATNGDDCIGFPLTGKYVKFVSEIIKQLTEDGYKVKHDNGYDQRGDDSWNSLLISWSK